MWSYVLSSVTVELALMGLEATMALVIKRVCIKLPDIKIKAGDAVHRVGIHGVGYHGIGDCVSNDKINFLSHSEYEVFIFLKILLNGFRC